MVIREYRTEDIPIMLYIWNNIIEAGDAFPQEEYLSEQTGAEYFAEQSFTAVCEIDGKLAGLYALHPNNVGRCAHIANACFAVHPKFRGMHVGENLVRDCLAKAKELGFRVFQLNAVVSSNIPALRLYKKLGFTQLGMIPGGFRLKDGTYDDIIPHFIEL